MLLPKQIIALGRIASRDSSRVYSAVRVERPNGRPRAVATDGRRAVIFTWDEPDAGEFPPIEGLSPKRVRGFATNVPARRTLADAGRGIPTRTPNPILSYMLLDESDASVVRVVAMSRDNVTRAQAKVEDTGFPNCDEVLPTPARDGTLYDPQRHGKTAFTHIRSASTPGNLPRRFR